MCRWTLSALPGSWLTAIGGLLSLAMAQPADEAYSEAMRDAREALSEGDHSLALRAVDTAFKIVNTAPANPKQASLAARLGGDIEAARRRWNPAARRYHKAAIVAGGLFHLRTAAQKRRRRMLRKLRAKARRQRVDAVFVVDARVRAWARRPRVPARRLARVMAGLDAAAKTYRDDRDIPHAAWVQAVRALVWVRSEEEERAQEAAQALLSRKPAWPGFVRMIAYDVMRRVHENKDVTQEASFALRMNALTNLHQPPDQRRYRRLRVLRKACRRYDAAKGAGACAALSKKLTGTYVFHNASRARPRYTLSPAAVQAAQAQFLPLLERCLREAARSADNADLFDGSTVTIGWTIDGQGRAQDAEFSPRRYDPVVGPCVREHLAWFRYPRSKDGQRPSVSIPFTLGDDPDLTAPPRGSNLGGEGR